MGSGTQARNQYDIQIEIAGQQTATTLTETILKTHTKHTDNRNYRQEENTRY